MDLFELFYRRFVIDNHAYLEQLPDGSYLGRYKVVTVDLTRRHLSGEITMAAPAASQHGCSIWICFDDDNALPELEEGLLDKIAQYLSAHGYYYVREGKRPLGNGLFKQGHMWVFFDRPIKKEFARGWGLMVMKNCGIGEKTPNFELFPKGGEDKNYAAGVRLPLGHHAKAGGQRIWLPDLPEDLDQQLHWLVSQPANAADRIEFLGSKQNELIEAEAQYRDNFRKVRYREPTGPTALQLLQELKWKLQKQTKFYSGRCPLCEDEGHDKSGDNLHVAKNGTWFGCYYDGWNEHHKPGQIYKKLLQLSGRT